MSVTRKTRRGVASVSSHDAGPAFSLRDGPIEAVIQAQRAAALDLAFVSFSNGRAYEDPAFIVKRARAWEVTNTQYLRARAELLISPGLEGAHDDSSLDVGTKGERRSA